MGWRPLSHGSRYADLAIAKVVLQFGDLHRANDLGIREAEFDAPWMCFDAGTENR